MGAVQTMTGGGGWPMSVFLTPDGRPFYGGTYFPDTPRHGMPSFRQVLDGVRTGVDDPASRRWSRRARGSSTRWSSRRRSGSAAGRSGCRLARRLTLPRPRSTASFDPVHGGWGRAPKFPQPMTIEFLLRRHVASGDPEPLEVALRSLGAMAAGGIHDQLGGGFHRYATDAAWLVPHFEQMLYDNAQLARVYVHAWALTGDASLLSTATGVLDYVLRELATPGRRVRRQPGRRHRGRGGRHVRLDGRRGARGPGRRGGPVRSRIRGHRRRQLGGPHDPVAGQGRRRARGAVRARRWRGRHPAGRRACRRCCTGGPSDRSRRSTTRCSRPGTGSRSPHSPMPPIPRRDR